MILILALTAAWQQYVSYAISADLDTGRKFLDCVEYVTYHNNSPSPLDTIYFHVYPNAYRDNNTAFARETEKMFLSPILKVPARDRGFIDINGVTANSESLSYLIDETIMAIVLPRTLVSGDSLIIRIDCGIQIPRIISRMGYRKDHFEMVQWYPKPCVFDQSGWHNDPYHALGEFYGEYGRFDVSIELPGDYVVAATGERTDSADAEFMHSLIRDGIKPPVARRKTVRFHAENVHDFAWVCDPDFRVEQTMFGDIAIEVYYTVKDRKKWKNASAYATDAVKRYERWFGPYPYKTLSIVDGYFGGGMEYPQLVIIGMDEDFITRFFELGVIHEIGHQWFYGVVGNNETDEAWLDEGFTTYTEMRYFEDKYGKQGSLLKSSIIPPFTDQYYQHLFYYLTRTNGLEQPVLTPGYEFTEFPLAYVNAAYAKPGLMLNNLEGMLGRPMFDSIMQAYYGRFAFKHPSSADFIAVCESISRQDLRPFFHGFLCTTGFCDWYVKSVRESTVEIANRGDIPVPVDVLIETELGGQVYHVSGNEKAMTIDCAPAKKIRCVRIDPCGYALETDYYNNYYPRRFEIKPILALPSFDSYQIFYCPYLWYDNDDGITPGLYLAGAEFVDFDFVKGRHQWIAGLVYGMKSKKFYPSFSYQTPLIFKKGLRSRVFAQFSNSNDEDKIKGGLATNLGIPFSTRKAITIENKLAYHRLNSFASVDSLDWDLGANMILDNSVKVLTKDLSVSIALSLADKTVNGDYTYAKAFLDVSTRNLMVPIPVQARLFCGRIFGTAPRQEQFFLAGKLRISQLADLVFSQRGDLSPQERVHITGEGNMTGYQTRHAKTRELYCAGLELPQNIPLRLFGDYGFYRDNQAPGSPLSTACDAGLKIAIGPISFNFPFLYKDLATGQPHWTLDWSIGF
jgi:hypothetical protein